MKKLIAVGILSVIATLMGILVIENVFDEKSYATREESIKKIVNPQQEITIEANNLR